MKKITIILLFSVSCFGQNAYRDAQLLSESGSAEILKRIQSIKTIPGYDNYDKKGDIENFEKFLNSPFDTVAKIDVQESLKFITAVEKIGELLSKKIKLDKNTLFDDTDADGIPDKADDCTNKTGLNPEGCPEVLKAAETLKGQSITTILVDALAKFLVDRVKQEITITFYDNFRSRLKETIIIPLTINKGGIMVKIKVEVKLRELFPQTFLLLESSRAFDTPSLGKTWVTAFKKDLITLPNKLELVVRNNKDLADTEIGRFTLMSYEIIDRAKKGDHPMIIIKNLSNRYNVKKDYTFQAQKVLGLLYLISSNLTYQRTDALKTFNVWATAEEFELLDDSSRRYLTALIYQQGVQSGLFKSIEFAGETLKDKINEQNFQDFYLHIEQMSSDFKTVTDMLATVKKDIPEQSTERALEDYANYLTAFYNLVDQNMKAMYTLMGIESEDYNQSFYAKDVKPVADAVIGINSALAQKNYAECILLSAGLMENILYKNLDTESPENSKEVLESFMYYSNFLADIIAASESKDSNNVKQIIENYAMPVGSYRIKRSYSHSWDVSAFPGLYGGYEIESSKSWSYGITAPVGISFSRKHTREEPSSSCSTFFLSVIDIGAPFSYRFSNDEAQGLPEEIKWEQIFSPGFFYIFGFNNTPLSLSAGIQFTPLLRDIEDENNVLQEKNIIRFSVGLMVDIPIFNLNKGNQNANCKSKEELEKKAKKEEQKKAKKQAKIEAKKQAKRDELKQEEI